ncbi:squalene--hopene cyclase [Paenibacillus ehimensis]|uniref:squalene--hopene cyclase n=1 Tax=Paenibacillus ehimensis TaxID=79264 RepID=UPI003D2D24E9
MSSLHRIVETATDRLMQMLLTRQSQDGTWRFCFENGIVTDGYLILLLRSLNIKDENLIRRLANRIVSKQEADGAWKWFHDDGDGHLSATVEAYAALRYAGLPSSDEALRRARRFILSKGGVRNVSGVLTKMILAVIGQYPWPRPFPFPPELLLLPRSFPLSFYRFSNYARVHLAPAAILGVRQFTVKPAGTPDLSELLPARERWSAHAEGSDFGEDRRLSGWWNDIQRALHQLPYLPQELRRLALRHAERYMLERIEPNGTLYSYASCTFLMVYALLALGYDKRHPVITQAVQGLISLACESEGQLHVQNSPSTVWDTALLSHALQEAGLPASHPAIRRADAYLLSRQHTKLGDWSADVANPVPGGWGFSDVNTIVPDVDDTTAALRALRRSPGRPEAGYREARSRGLHWVLSLQNDDGGWPAFERNKNSPLLAALPVDGAEEAALDASAADLTGRTLEYLGTWAGLGQEQPFIRRAVQWLLDRQERNGSWYGRWGICYIYGTWAAVTGLAAAGVPPDQPELQQAVRWLAGIQNPDGGFGESCRSDRAKLYIPLGASTPSQTAWALDALIAVHPAPTDAINRAAHALSGMVEAGDASWPAKYPTGAALPGDFYVRYHSYNAIWPLLALAHYRSKYGSRP